MLKVTNANFPYLAASSRSFRPRHCECHYIVGKVSWISVNGILFDRSSSIAEIPMPGSDRAITIVLETYRTRIGNYSKSPITLHSLAELWFERHQCKQSLHRGIAKHLVMFRKIPEAIVLLLPIVINHRPC